MNLCSSDHDEICFEGRTCPLCSKAEELREQISDLEDRIDNLKSENSDLESKVDNLKSENESLSEQLAEAENGAST